MGSHTKVRICENLITARISGGKLTAYSLASNVRVTRSGSMTPAHCRSSEHSTGSRLPSTIKEILMRLLHTMLRVGDLDRSLAFYTDVLGMELLRSKDYPDGKFTLALVGYQEPSAASVTELNHY